MSRFAVFWFVLFGMHLSEAAACIDLPTMEQREQALRNLINKADRVFVGQVTRKSRRRRGPKDHWDRFLMRQKELRDSGRNVDADIENLIDFAWATVELKVILPLKQSEARDNSKISVWNDIDRVVIDHLRPSALNRPICHSIPQTCPWSIKEGEFVAVAIKTPDNAPAIATLCFRVEKPTAEDRSTIKNRQSNASADGLLWPFLEAARARAKRKADSQVPE